MRPSVFKPWTVLYSEPSFPAPQLYLLRHTLNYGAIDTHLWTCALPVHLALMFMDHLQFPQCLRQVCPWEQVQKDKDFVHVLKALCLTYLWQFLTIELACVKEVLLTPVHTSIQTSLPGRLETFPLHPTSCSHFFPCCIPFFWYTLDLVLFVCQFINHEQKWQWVHCHKKKANIQECTSTTCTCYV